MLPPRPRPRTAARARPRHPRRRLRLLPPRGALPTANRTEMTLASEHWGVDNLFNIREANPDVECGQWQFELNGLWFSQAPRRSRDAVADPQVRNHG